MRPSVRPKSSIEKCHPTPLSLIEQMYLYAVPYEVLKYSPTLEPEYM